MLDVRSRVGVVGGPGQPRLEAMFDPVLDSFRANETIASITSLRRLYFWSIYPFRVWLSVSLRSM